MRVVQSWNRLLATGLALLVVTTSVLAASTAAPTFSVMDVPPTQGGQQAQVAVKWSGALPARLQAGAVDRNGDFAPLGTPVTLRDPMSLLPKPTGALQEKATHWRVVDEDEEILAETTIGSMQTGWQRTFHGPGLDNRVYAMAVFQGDLVVAGTSDGLRSNVPPVVRWDGSSWSALASAPDGFLRGEVLALTVYEGKLIAGGRFADYPALQSFTVASWNGSAWSALKSATGTGIEQSVRSLVVYDGTLVAGGDFLEIDGTTVNGVARWDGSSWSPLEGTTGVGVGGPVHALTEYGGALIAGGEFAEAGSLTVNHVARWDGSAWSALSGPDGVGVNGPVRALLGYAGALIVGGEFSSAGAVTAQSIARWDGSGWSPLGNTVDTALIGWTVLSMIEHDGALIVGGAVRVSDCMGSCVLRWDGAAWSPLVGPSGVGTDSLVTSLAVFDGELIAGGQFHRVGDVAVNSVARWDNRSWSPLLGDAASGLLGSVRALAVYNGSLIAGGTFEVAGDRAVYSIARWDGIQWFALVGSNGAGMGPYSNVRALVVYDDDLVVGGSFGIEGDVFMGSIARWNGEDWSALAGPSGESLGFEGNAFAAAEVFALAVYDGALIAGGRFDDAGNVRVNNIASWDGSNWSPLFGPSRAGVTFNFGGAVYALTLFDGTLIASGGFTSAGGVGASRVARWNGSEWSALAGPAGQGIDGPVFALTVHDGALIAGGRFSTAGGLTANHIARWDGGEWSALSNPATMGTNAEILALTSFNGALIVGGYFDLRTVDGVRAHYIARWDGHWTALDRTGTDYRVYALTSHHDALIAGGDFGVADRVPSWQIGEYRSGAIDPGISGLWFNPERDGEGFSIEILDNGVGVVVWYTYDVDGGQMWLIGTGDVDGRSLRVHELVRPLGARFGPGFDPGEVERVPWGSLRIDFEDCSKSWLRYQGPEGYGAVHHELVRLAQMSGIGCGSAVGGEGAAFSGLFYDPARDGEGFSIQVVDAGQGATVPVGFWFTFTPEGDQAWLIGTGRFEDGSRFIVDEVLQPIGARFGAEFDPEAVERLPWGSWVIDYADCKAATLAYDSTRPGYFAIQQNLVRLSRPLGVNCPAP